MLREVDIGGIGIRADTFEELAETVVKHLNDKRGLSMVCGPITTGGTGNRTHNLEVFNATVRGLEGRGKQLFNQVPYELCLRRLASKWKSEGNFGYCMPILTVFYTRVFKSGAITEGWFIPGWNSSFGARWERDTLADRGCITHDLTHADIREFLQAEYPPEHVGLLMGSLADGVLDNYRRKPVLA